MANNSFVEDIEPIVTSLVDTARDNSGIKSHQFQEAWRDPFLAYTLTAHTNPPLHS